MDIVRQPHFRGQRDKTSGYARTVRLLDIDFQMGSLDDINDFFGQLGEQLRDDVIPRQPLPVLGFEKFLANDALRIDEEIARPGHALELPDGFAVQNMVIAYGFRS